ncbi:MAG: NTP transferase domain-containing protein [Oscillospiraceae bacterium]|nr:NTP transferase domain-containing protein [Oscillospiraceae bacterium]
MAYGETMRRLSPCGDEYVARLVGDAGSVLDVGCGRGDRLSYLAQMGTKRLCGAEPDPENAALARRNCPAAEITECGAASLPYPTGSFDAVLCECVFSLLDRPEEALAEMRRVLRPGGRLILSDLYARAGTADTEGDGVIGKLYAREELERMFTEADFEQTGFEDKSGELYAMAAQMILDGVFCACMSPKTAAALKKAKAGYGVWLLRKQRVACRVAAVIPAAGLSSRMGDFKPLLPFGGGTVLSSCADALRAAGAEETVIVTGKRAADIEAALPFARFVHNPDFAETEMFDSLRLGLAALSETCERVLVTPGDVPAVSPETARALLNTEADAARPLYHGTHGHPLLLRGTLIPRLMEYGGEDGLRGALRALGVAVLNVETDDRGAVLDADTPEEYRLIRSLGGGI